MPYTVLHFRQYAYYIKVKQCRYLIATRNSNLFKLCIDFKITWDTEHVMGFHNNCICLSKIKNKKPKKI